MTCCRVSRIRLAQSSALWVLWLSLDPLAQLLQCLEISSKKNLLQYTMVLPLKSLLTTVKQNQHKLFQLQGNLGMISLSRNDSWAGMGSCGLQPPDVQTQTLASDPGLTGDSEQEPPALPQEQKNPSEPIWPRADFPPCPWDPKASSVTQGRKHLLYTGTAQKHTQLGWEALQTSQNADALHPAES